MGEKYRSIEELIQIALGQYEQLDDHAYVDEDVDVLPREGKVLVTKSGEVEEAFSKSGTFELQLLPDGSLQLKVYYSPDNWNPAIIKKSISLAEAEKIFGEAEIVKGLEELLSHDKKKEAAARVMYDDTMSKIFNRVIEEEERGNN